MTMSRKHYREVADILNDELNSLLELTEVEQAAARATVISIAGHLASMFYHDNPNFQISKFMEASGIE